MSCKRAKQCLKVQLQTNLIYKSIVRIEELLSLFAQLKRGLSSWSDEMKKRMLRLGDNSENNYRKRNDTKQVSIDESKSVAEDS